jgi:hypothetical protein
MPATGQARLSRAEVRRFDWDASDLSSALYAQEFLDTEPSAVSPPPVARRRLNALIAF